MKNVEGYDAEQVLAFEQSRNPNSVFADLHEHLRRNRVLSVCLNPNIDKALLPRRRLDLDWVRPIYDMQSFAKRYNDDAFYYPMRDRGIELNEAGTLIPDKLAFMWTTLVEPPNGEDWRWMECIAAIDPVIITLRARPERGEQSGFLAHMFEREQWLRSKRMVYYGQNLISKPTPWMCRRAFYSTTGWCVEIDEDKYSGLDGLTLSDRDSYDSQSALLLAFCGTIASEPQLTAHGTSERFASMNRGRHMGQLAPVPPIRRILDVARKVYQSHGSGSHTGREMPKHFRRGTFRTFRHDRFINVRGQQRPVKSTVVRSDKDGEIAVPVYDVVGKLPLT